MNKKSQFKIIVNGYVCEIVCGQIPRACKEVFTQYIRETRNDSSVPQWIRSRTPDYVSPEEIKRIWYEPNEVMEALMGACEFPWQGYRRINDLYHLQGFGSGKQGIGIFDMSVFAEDRLVAEFVPFDPPADANQLLLNIRNVPQRETEPLTQPKAKKQMIAVSAGSWGKGTMEFRFHTETDFDPSSLEMMVIDATQLGIGEDHLVHGLRYNTHVLPGTIARETDKEMYPVSWYSPEKNRWLDMYEA